MGNRVYYQGRDIGEIKLDENRKMAYIANKLEDLETLFRLSPQDELEIDQLGKISYERFREQHLRSIHAIYSTLDNFLLKDSESKSIEEFERSQTA